ncbi:hypothetical protein DAI22_08g143200 [Oryza sativa Japonica Group]|nr:hypothetical protein DAI22_08g143200 [Oryza sativa Japonica Group]
MLPSGLAVAPPPISLHAAASRTGRQRYAPVDRRASMGRSNPPRPTRAAWWRTRRREGVPPLPSPPTGTTPPQSSSPAAGAARFGGRERRKGEKRGKSLRRRRPR